MNELFLIYGLGGLCLAIGLVTEIGYLCFGKEPPLLMVGLTDAGVIITLGVISWCVGVIGWSWYAG